MAPAGGVAGTQTHGPLGPAPPVTRYLPELRVKEGTRMGTARRSTSAYLLRGLLAAALSATMWLAVAQPASAAIVGMERVSTEKYDEPSRDGDSSRPRMSANGQYVVFESDSGTLVNVQVNQGVFNIFIRDRFAGTTTLVTRGVNGPANNPSHTPAISADGTYVVFVTLASNLTTDPANGPGTYRWSRDKGIERVDVLAGQPPGSWNTGQGNWWYPSVSENGNLVAFTSADAGLPGGNGQLQVYRRDMTTGDVVQVSVGASGSGGQYPSISADGSRIAFRSSAALVATDTNPLPDVYLRDLNANSTTLLSGPSPGLSGSSGSSKWPAMSGNGQVVAFTSTAGNLVATDTAGQENVFARDLTTGAIELVSLRNTLAVLGGCYNPGVSSDGRYVSFQSDADNVIVSATAPTNPYYALFIRDRIAGTTTGVGKQFNQASASGSSTSMSADGRYIAFDSNPTTAGPDPLVAGDDNGKRDVFFYDRRPQVKATLSTPKLSTTRPRHRIYFSVSGTVTRHTGAKAKVQLEFKRRVGTVYRRYKTYTVYTAVGATSYKLRVRLPYTGKWLVRAYHPADSAHLRSWSSIRYFTVRT
jgi:Tol biopolymer transport system component